LISSVCAVPPAAAEGLEERRGVEIAVGLRLDQGDDGLLVAGFRVQQGQVIRVAGLILAAHLIERHLGRAVAQKASQILLFDRERDGSETQPHPPLPETVTEPRVRRALLLMEQNLARPIAIASIARELGLSMRQLERLCHLHVGMGPASLYRQLRMRYANWLIENTDRSVTDIANEAGFADCAHFSRQFKDAYGLSPSTRRLQPHRAPHGDAARARVFE